MKYTVYLNDDQIADLVRLHLIESYEIVRDLYKSSTGDKSDKKMKKVLLKVIRYYSSPSEWKEFKDTL